MTRDEHLALLRRASTMRLGLEGYVKVLAYCRHRARSTAEICAHMELNQNTGAKLMRNMLRLKLVHREQWFRPQPHSRELPRWKLGAQGDTEAQTPRSIGKSAPNALLIGLAAAIECLQEHPVTLKELAADLGVHPETAARIVGMLRNAGLSTIRAWQQLPHGPNVALHGWMGRADAEPVTRCEDMPAVRRRWRQTSNAKRAHIELLHASARPLAVETN